MPATSDCSATAAAVSVSFSAACHKPSSCARSRVAVDSRRSSTPSLTRYDTTCTREASFSASTVRTSVRPPLVAAMFWRLCSCTAGARCSRSFCSCAKASCWPRVCSICALSRVRERTMPSSPRQPSTATMARMVIATSSSISVKPRARGVCRRARIIRSTPVAPA